jgi:hypothetical protein
MNQSFELFTHSINKGVFDKITVVFGKFGFKIVHRRSNPNGTSIWCILYDKIVTLSDINTTGSNYKSLPYFIVTAYTLESPHNSDTYVIIGSQADIVHQLISSEYQKICKIRDNILGIDTAQ